MKLKSIHTGVDLVLPSGRRDTWLQTGERQNIQNMELTLTSMEGVPIVVVTGKGIPTDEPICVPLVNIRSFIPMKPKAQAPVLPEKADDVPLEAPKKKKKLKD